jgi:hypothetical protein
MVIVSEVAAVGKFDSAPPAAMSMDTLPIITSVLFCTLMMFEPEVGATVVTKRRRQPDPVAGGSVTVVPVRTFIMSVFPSWTPFESDWVADMTTPPGFSFARRISRPLYQITQPRGSDVLPVQMTLVAPLAATVTAVVNAAAAVVCNVTIEADRLTNIKI